MVQSAIVIVMANWCNCGSYRWAITVSFFEIYNEQVVDLLAEAHADGAGDAAPNGGGGGGSGSGSGATASGYSLKRDHPSAVQEAWNAPRSPRPLGPGPVL